MTHRTRTLAIAASALVAGITVGGVQLTRAASGSTATSVVPVEPYRVLDTRLGKGAPAAPVGAGQTIDVQIAGVGPVPSDAVGVVLNITGTRTTQATYVTAWPTGGVQPTASVLNLTPGIDAPNGVTALLGDGGKLSLFNFTGSTDLIADIAGYLVATGSGGGPQGPQGPPGPGAIPINTYITGGATATVTSLDGITITASCDSGTNLMKIAAASGNVLWMGGIGWEGATPIAFDHTGNVGFQVLSKASTSPLHYSGEVSSGVVKKVYQLDLHLSKYPLCRLWGSAVPVN